MESKSDEELSESTVDKQPSEHSTGESSDEAEPATVAEEIAAKKRKISHHRKRGVSSSSLKEFPWLRSVRGRNGKIGMRCHLCTKH